MPRLANIYLIFDFFINNADFRITRLRSHWADAEKKGAVESEHRHKLINFCVYYVQRRLSFDYAAKKFILKEARFKKNSALTLKVISLALGMCYFQGNSEGVLSELKIMLRQYQNGAIASTLVVALNNFVEKSNFTVTQIRQKDEALSLSIRYSCPRELAAHLISETGVETAREILENSIKPPEAVFRLNCAKLYTPQLREEFLKQFAEKYLVDLKRVYRDMPFYSCDRSAFNFFITELSEFKAGYITPAGRSAFLAAYLLDAQADELILDACAAPGNKTTHIAELSSSGARIIAADISDAKIAKINDNIDRLKLNNIFTICASSEFIDADKLRNKFSSFGDETEIFDRILLDAPCSGLGLIRNRIELKYRFNVSDLTAMPRLQSAILNNASRLLKKGGYLLYSTCTINKRENSNLVAEFLSANKNFRLISLKDKMKIFAYDFSVLNDDYESMQILPDGAGNEGFFYALMQKE